MESRRANETFYASAARCVSISSEHSTVIGWAGIRNLFAHKLRRVSSASIAD